MTPPDHVGDDPVPHAGGGAQGLSTARLTGLLNGTYGPKTQRAGCRIAAGGTNTTSNGVNDLHARIPFRLPVSTIRVRVHVWNRDTKNAGAGNVAGAITYYGIYVGLSTPDAVGAPTNVFAATPTQLSSGFVTDATGATESVTPWTAVSLPAGRDLLLSFGLHANAGQVHNRSQGFMWFTTTTNGNDPQVGPGNLTMAQGSTTTTAAWHDMWLEYETADGAAHGLIVGDSLTSGTSTTFPFRDGYASIASCNLGFAATVAAWHGSNIQNDWSNTAEPKWAAMAAVSKPQFIDIGLGSNDFGNARTLAQVQADLGTLINNLRMVIADVPIYVRTIMPRTFTGQVEADRLAFNAWLRARPFGIAGYFDVATLVADPATPAQLLAAYNSGDNIHINTLGQALTATACRPRTRFVQGAAAS